jgi:hypothetical protein
MGIMKNKQATGPLVRASVSLPAKLHAALTATAKANKLNVTRQAEDFIARALQLPSRWAK